MSSARERYVAAYQLGETGRDATLCGQLFSRCPADGQQILAAIGTAAR